MHKEFTLEQIEHFIKANFNNQSIAARMFRALWSHLTDPSSPMLVQPPEGRAHFMGTARIQLRPKSNTASTMESVDFFLHYSGNVDGKQYVDEEGTINSLAGNKMLSQCFLHGLSGNITEAHASGRWNEVEHLKYVHAELDRAVFHASHLGRGFRNPNEGPGDQPPPTAQL